MTTKNYFRVGDTLKSIAYDEGEKYIKYFSKRNGAHIDDDSCKCTMILLEKFNEVFNYNKPKHNLYN